MRQCAHGSSCTALLVSLPDGNCVTGAAEVALPVLRRGKCGSEADSVGQSPASTACRLSPVSWSPILCQLHGDSRACTTRAWPRAALVLVPVLLSDRPAKLLSGVLQRTSGKRKEVWSSGKDCGTSDVKFTSSPSTHSEGDTFNLCEHPFPRSSGLMVSSSS